MAGDCISTKRMVVIIQENGIIRNEEGRLIARLADDVEFNSEHIYNQPIARRRRFK